MCYRRESREGRKRGEGKKKREEREERFFFAFGSDIQKSFSFVHQSSPALARAMNSERVVAKSFYHHRQHDAMKSRPFALALSLTLFLSSLNNLHSLLLKNENIFERVFSMCKIKNLPLCPRKKEISLGSKSSIYFFSNQRTPASTSYNYFANGFLYHRRFSSLLLFLLLTERELESEHTARTRARYVDTRAERIKKTRECGFCI